MVDIVAEIVPWWRSNFPREIIPISEMRLKARISTAGHLLLGPFMGGGGGGQRYKLVMQMHSSVYNGKPLQPRPNASPPSRDQTPSLGFMQHFGRSRSVVLTFVKF